MQLRALLDRQKNTEGLQTRGICRSNGFPGTWSGIIGNHSRVNALACMQGDPGWLSLSTSSPGISATPHIFDLNIFWLLNVAGYEHH